MADEILEFLPLIKEEDYDQFRKILKVLPPTYAEWLENYRNMRAELERPYKHDLSKIEIREIEISPYVFAQYCVERGGCRSIEDLGYCAREEYEKLKVADEKLRQQNEEYNPIPDLKE